MNIVHYMLPSIDQIKKKRISLGMTQKDLAGVSGVSQSLIAKLESGNMVPSYKNMKSIFDTLEGIEKKEEPKALNIANKKVYSIGRREKVSTAVEIMKKRGLSQLPVFDGKHVVGSISEKSILDTLMKSNNPKEIHDMKIEGIMDSAFPLVDENFPVSVISSMLQHSPAVLISNKDEIVGLVTKADLLKII